MEQGPPLKPWEKAAQAKQAEPKPWEKAAQSAAPQTPPAANFQQAPSPQAPISGGGGALPTTQPTLQVPSPVPAPKAIQLVDSGGDAIATPESTSGLDPLHLNPALRSTPETVKMRQTRNRFGQMDLQGLHKARQDAAMAKAEVARMTAGFDADSKQLELAGTDLEAKRQQAEQIMASDPVAGQQAAAEYDQEQARYNGMVQSLNKQQHAIQDLQSGIATDEEAARFREYEIKSQIGTPYGAAHNALMEGIGSLVSGLEGGILDLSLLHNSPFSPAHALLESELKRTKAELLPKLREAPSDAWGASGTTKEYMEEMHKGLFGGAVLDLAQMAPAMATPLMSGIALQTMDSAEQEMQGPQWEGVSESEKALIKVPLGVTAAALTEMGFKNLARNTPFVKSVLATTLENVPLYATEDQLKRTLSATAKDMATDYLMKTASGAAAGAEVGVGQHVMGVGMRDLYNKIHGGGPDGTPMFRTPETWKEYFADLQKSGVNMAVGMALLAQPMAVSAAMRKGSLGKTATPAQFEVTEGLMKDPHYDEALATDLEQKVQSGKLTQVQADEVRTDWEQAKRIRDKIPDDIPLGSRMKAFDLIAQRDALKKLDPALVATKVQHINEQLAALEGVPEVPEPKITKDGVKTEPKPIKPTGDEVTQSSTLPGSTENVDPEIYQRVGEFATSPTNPIPDLKGTIYDPRADQSPVPMNTNSDIVDESNNAVSGVSLRYSTPEIPQDPFKYQDQMAEHLIGKGAEVNKIADWKSDSNYVRYKLENAGDVLRGLSRFSEGIGDRSYAMGKLHGVQEYIDRWKEGNLHNDDTMSGASEANPELWSALKDAYGKQPVHNQEQRDAADLIMSLLNNDLNSAEELAAKLKSYLSKPTPQENATQEGVIEQGSEPEHLGTAPLRPTNEAGRSDSNEPSGPIEAAPEAEQVEPERVKKTFATRRAYEGEFRDEVKDEIEKGGLYRDVEKQPVAEAEADAFIAKVGIDAAYDAAEAGDIRGGARTVIRVRKMEALDSEFMEETDPDRLAEIVAEQGKLIQDLDRAYTEGGRESAMLAHMYEQSDLGFKSSVRTEKWKKEFGTEPPEDVKAMMKRHDEEIADLKQKFAAAEKRAEEAEARAPVDAIRESIAREKAQKRTYAQKSKDLANQFRRLKTKPMSFTDADGNPIKITEQGFNWNELVELGAKAIEKTGELADGIAAIAERLKNLPWFAEMNDRNKKAVMDQIEGAFRESSGESLPGRIKISKRLVREAVEGGAKGIDSLVKVIKDIVKEEYPDATDREIRDAITDYGKVVNMSKDELSTEIRRIRRIGRITSALEDVQEKKRPLRSGLQRDKMDAEERALNKQLKDALKELPADAEAQQQELRTALDAAKTRTRNRIEDLQREIDTRERRQRTVKSLEADEELKQLISQRDELQAEHDKIFEDKSATEEERLQRAVDSARRSVEKYRKLIADKEVDTKRPSAVKETPELTAIRNELQKAREEYRKMQEDAGVIEKKKLETAKKAANTRIKELERRIEQKDFTKKETKAVVADTELIKLRAEKLRLKEEYDKEFYKNKLRTRTKFQKFGDAAMEAWGLTRALQATGELSFVGMQGGAMTISNMWHKPEAVASAFKNMVNSMRSEKRSAEWLRNIKSQDWYPQAKEAKLAITEPHAEITAREELFVSDWTRMIWNALGVPLEVTNKKLYDKWKKANPFRALERGAAAYLDTLRVERFLDGLDMLEKKKGEGEEITKQDYKDVADVANTLTGRASLGKAEIMSKGLTKVFFSPRLWASSIKTGTPYGLYHFGKMTPTARKMAVQDLGRFIGTTMVFVGAAAIKYNNDDDPDTGVEMDPRSSDFGKIKIGQTRIDPWGGRIQQLILTSRLVSGAAGLAQEKPMGAYKNAKGEVYPLGVPFKSPTMTETALRMATNKLAPSASFLFEAASTELKKNAAGEMERQTPFGEKYDIKERLNEKMIPIYFGTVKDLMKEDPGALEGFLLLYSFLGGGVQTYEDRSKPKEEPKRKASHARF